MTKVYNVRAASGQYEDRTEWSVASYFSEELALAHVAAAELWWKENIDWRFGSGKAYEQIPRDLIQRNPLDPMHYLGDDQRSYMIEVEEVLEALPTGPIERYVVASWPTGCFVGDIRLMETVFPELVGMDYPTWEDFEVVNWFVRFKGTRNVRVDYMLPAQSERWMREKHAELKIDHPYEEVVLTYTAEKSK